MSDLTFTFHFHALEKEMATHSSVLAWRIPGTGEPGGLQSLGSHRVGHDWSNLAAAAAALNKANIWQKTEVREKFFFLSHLNHSTWEIENAFSKKSNELINKKKYYWIAKSFMNTDIPKTGIISKLFLLSEVPSLWYVFSKYFFEWIKCIPMS